MKQNQRYAYLDLLKAVAITCVCLYHFPLISETVFTHPLRADVMAREYFRAWNAVCVPLFMMVNGALLLNRRFDLKKHALQCIRLFAGLIVWYLVTMFAAHAWTGGAAYALSHAKGILLSAMYVYEYNGIALNHLWFVQMLLAIYVLVPLIRAAYDSPDVQMRRGLAFAMGVLLCLCVLTQDFEHVKAPLPVLRALDLTGLATVNPARNSVYGAMIVYFVLGGYLHRAYDRLTGTHPLVSVSLFFSGSLLLFAEWYAMTRRTDALYDIVYNGYNCLPTMMMASGLFIGAAKLNARLSACRLSRALHAVGANTLAVYYLHWLMGLTVLTLVNAAQGNFLINLLKAAAMVLSGTLLGMALRRVPLLRHLV